VSRILTVFPVAFLLFSACTPEDNKIESSRARKAAEATSEKSQVKGLDYVEYAVYRLAEIKQVMDTLADNDEKKKGRKKKSGATLCGRLNLDRQDGNQRLVSFVTRDCLLPKAGDEHANLHGVGTERVSVSLDSNGDIVQVWLKSVGPYMVDGKVPDPKGKDVPFAGSELDLEEDRDLAVDLADVSGDQRSYAFTYSVRSKWRQDLKGSAFLAKENGEQTIRLSGSINMAGEKSKTVRDLTVDSIIMKVVAPRTITERTRRRSKAQDETFHVVNLEIQPAKAEKAPVPLIFDPKGCGLPWGELVADKYSSNNGDKEDRLYKQIKNIETGKKEMLRTLRLGATGIEVAASGKSRAWYDCSEPEAKVAAGEDGTADAGDSGDAVNPGDADDPGDSGDSGDGDHSEGSKKKNFRAVTNEVRNRIPYGAIFFK
jgi:hypothetical protein